jgi:general secretion pathway protein G
VTRKGYCNHEWGHDAPLPRSVEQSMRKILALSAVILGGALAVLAFSPSRCTPEGALEMVLRTNLHTMRDVIGQYHGDRGRYPESLEVLIDAGYLRKVPIDPFTKSTVTWRLTYEGRPGMDGTRGVVNVHSGARGTARDGRPLAGL